MVTTSTKQKILIRSTAAARSLACWLYSPLHWLMLTVVANFVCVPHGTLLLAVKQWLAAAGSGVDGRLKTG